MRQTIKILLWVGLMALFTQAARAYTPIGPVAFGDDAWQTTTIGYNPLGDGNAVPYIIDGLLTGPKNLGEEYRRNTPVMYYAVNANFLDYFGSNGVVAVDQAYAILNNAFSTNVDSFSLGLTEFPLKTQGVNYQATALDLLDMKSVTLELMAEQLGLADSVRYTWALHNRFHVTPGPACPLNMEYNVIMRNFDITSTPLSFNPPDWGQYSPYVNGELYTYTIIENCGAALISPPLADAYEVPTDPLSLNPPVASSEDGLLLGEFYTGLTRDDMAGLRYLLSTNNANTETPGGGSLLLVTNFPSPQLITTLPLAPFILQSQILDPGALLALYPGLIIASTVTNFSFVTTTNVTAAFTNQPGPSVTNFSPPQVFVTGDLGLLIQEAATNNPASLVALYPGLVVSTVTNYAPVQVVVTNTVFAFTNQPGPTVTNGGTLQFLNPPPNAVPPPITTGTEDFGFFTLQVQTNTTGQTVNPALAIAQLQALHPGLVVLSATPYFTNVVTTNFITTLQIPPKSPLGTPPVQVTSISGVFTNYEIQYTYTFGNLLLDSNGTFYPFVDYNTSRSLYSTNVSVTIQTISVTNLTGSPLGNPAFTNTTTTTKIIPGITGDFFIEPTNWCGFTIVTPLAVTKLDSFVLTLTAASTTNTIPGSITNGIAQFTQTTTFTYTNRQFWIQPGICEPVLTNFVTYATNLVITNYQNTLLNVFTNSYSSNSFVTLLTTNIFTTNGASAGALFTNVSQVSYYTNIPTGDFIVIPTNWCGFDILSVLAPTVVTSTNIVTAGPSPIFSAPGGVLSGVSVSYSQETISEFTNHTLVIQPGVCEPALIFTTNVVGAVVTNYQETFANVVTNSFFTNTLLTIITTNIEPCPGGSVGVLCTNISSVTIVSNTPSGDFWIVPAAWNCGYTILSVPFSSTVGVTNTIITATNSPGVANIGQQFSITEISIFTNHSLLIQPIICQTEPASARLYQGIGRTHFVRANYDSLLSQFFQPITNVYSMTLVTNGQTVVQYFQRVVTVPDFLFTAQDFAPGPETGPVIGAVPDNRNINFDTANAYPGLAGPGVINPPTTFIYNKVGIVYLNTSPSFLNGPNDGLVNFIWGSFDSSTNPPVIYPNGTSIQNLESQVLIQITSMPTTLPDATNGYAYNASFSATGGQPPYTWSLGSGTQLPQSLTLSTNGVISGMVTNNVPGVYVFTVQLNDSANRVESVNYFITVH